MGKLAGNVFKKISVDINTKSNLIVKKIAVLCTFKPRKSVFF